CCLAASPQKNSFIHQGYIPVFVIPPLLGCGDENSKYSKGIAPEGPPGCRTASLALRFLAWDSSSRPSLPYLQIPLLGAENHTDLHEIYTENIGLFANLQENTRRHRRFTRNYTVFTRKNTRKHWGLHE